MIKHALLIQSALYIIVKSTRSFTQSVLYKMSKSCAFCSKRNVHNCKKYTVITESVLSKLLKDVHFIHSALYNTVKSTLSFTHSVLYKMIKRCEIYSKRNVHNCKKYTFIYSKFTL